MSFLTKLFGKREQPVCLVQQEIELQIPLPLCNGPVNDTEWGRDWPKHDWQYESWQRSGYWIRLNQRCSICGDTLVEFPDMRKWHTPIWKVPGA